MVEAGQDSSDSAPPQATDTAALPVVSAESGRKEEVRDGKLSVAVKTFVSGGESVVIIFRM